MDTDRFSTFSGGSTNADGDCVAHFELIWCWPPSDATSVPLLRVCESMGRSDSCSVRLTDSQVSFRHAEITQQRGSLIIRDLGSTNGTFVDGHRVENAKLVPGSIVRIGRTVGVLARSTRVAPVERFSPLAPGLLGGGRLEQAVAPARQMARGELPILLEGESGTGKERVARAIHLWSQRPGDFVAVNCAAIPESLADGELFGYRRGAFTGAVSGNLGHVRAAHQGTLLLDEVVELPTTLQAKLLRVIEEREVPTLGQPKPVAVDLRVIAAAQRPLSESVLEGKFRADLYARLNGLTVRVPPLRERPEDIVPLFVHFYQRASSGVMPDLDARVVEALCLHGFPMNVRELRMLAERLAGGSRHPAVLKLSHFRGQLCTDGGPLTRSHRARARKHHDLARLGDALAKHDGNVSRAARAAGISRQRAYRLLERIPKASVEVDELPGDEVVDE